MDEKISPESKLLEFMVKKNQMFTNNIFFNNRCKINNFTIHAKAL